MNLNRVIEGADSRSDGRQIVTGGQSLDIVVSKLRSFYQDRRVSIYEAGGGAKPKSAGWFPDSFTTVVDLAAPETNSDVERFERINGDIRTYCPAGKSFDLVVCYDVLEHVSQPTKALLNFCKMTKPGGLILIASPCFWSLNAFVAKLTPYWFHVWFYRRIMRKPLAGTKGQAPFPTHHAIDIDPDRLITFFAARDFEIVYFRKFSNDHMQKLSHMKPWLFLCLNAVIYVMNAFAFGARDFAEGDFHLLVRRIR